MKENVQTGAVAQTHKRILVADMGRRLKWQSDLFAVVTVLWDLCKSDSLVQTGYF